MFDICLLLFPLCDTPNSQGWKCSVPEYVQDGPLKQYPLILVATETRNRSSNVPNVLEKGICGTNVQIVRYVIRRSSSLNQALISWWSLPLSAMRRVVISCVGVQLWVFVRSLCARIFRENIACPGNKVN